MDTSFAVQALSVEHVAKNHKDMAPGVYSFPAEMDQEIAKIRLKVLGIGIDSLTAEQEEYLSTWEHGT